MTAITDELARNPTRHKGLRCHVIDGEALLYDSQANLTHRLNGTALFIWEQCDGARSPDQIAERMTRIYDVDLEAARADVRSAMAEMQRNGLLQETPQDDP